MSVVTLVKTEVKMESGREGDNGRGKEIANKTQKRLL